MALSSRNVEKAMEILMDITAMKAPFFAEHDNENPDRTGIILVAGKVGDGWENVFINIRNITTAQLDKFNNREKEVHNSSFINKSNDNEITCIGWF